MQLERERLRHRTDARACGPEGVRALGGMATLDALATALTAADVDPEAGDDRRAGIWQVNLVALLDAFFDEIAAALTCLWRRGVELTVDLGWHGTMTVAAVAATGLAPGSSRLVLRLSLRERCRLALSRAAGLLQETLELGDALVAFREGTLETTEPLGELLDRRGVGARFSLARSPASLLAHRGSSLLGSPSPLATSYMTSACKWWMLRSPR